MKSTLTPTTEHSVKIEPIVFLLIMAVAFAVYWKALSNGFLINWDDPNYVVNNIDSHGFSLGHVKNAFSRFYVGNYAPLHIVSYMLDYSLWGLKPAGYIFHNMLLHALNGYLLYLLVFRISHALYPSILSAIMFVVHPVQVESVVWISQRKNVLSMLFFLMAFHLYLSYRDSASCKKAVWYTLSLLLFACALLVKSVAVVLPVGLLLYDLCIDRRAARSALYDKLPFLFTAVAAVSVAMLSQSDDQGLGGRAPFHGGSPYATFLTMIPVFVNYLRIIILPTGLSGVYLTEIKTSVDWSVAWSGAVLILLGIIAWLILRADRKLFFWIAIGVIGILPVSQIIPLVTLMNDRYLYFPMTGIAPFIILGSATIISGFKKPIRHTAIVFLLFILIIFGFMTVKRSTVWKDSLTLWSDALVKNPKNYQAKYNLANLYSETGNLDKLRQTLQELLSAQPNSAKSHELLGHYFYKAGNLESAEKAYKKALELSPRLANSYFCLGNIYLAKKDLKSAEEFFIKAEKFGSMTPDLSYSFACLESLKGNLPEALRYLDNAFNLGFKACSAVMINDELKPLHGSQEYIKIIRSYCSERRI